MAISSGSPSCLLPQIPDISMRPLCRLSGSPTRLLQTRICCGTSKSHQPSPTPTAHPLSQPSTLSTEPLHMPSPMQSAQLGPAFRFEPIAECPQTSARRAALHLPHCPAGPVETPVFMPVGTQGAMKGITVEQLESIDCRIILGNTYHLGDRPGPDVMSQAGGLHKFMSWPRAILTDSGGFQMVSLCELSSVDETGVTFISPHIGTKMLLTPEYSVGCLQAAIGADIVMQLDHVLHVLSNGADIKDATFRSIRWLDSKTGFNAGTNLGSVKWCHNECALTANI
ncbi:unnamed protein product [Protopolystoma xenopodis]|uniref:tRNA-guanine(15) transglycosylase-like domain-containing protein n=1 Tax=Protopolystoma xenopodis TaxID=117903 RepID=A0A448WQR3_9PLAT|nr:unnamed protein product [Protopolystoma xenopodis]